MRNYILIFFLLIAVTSKAQFFNNVNSELCYQLYETSDPVGKFRVYIVIDPEVFTDFDRKMLAQWDTLSPVVRQRVTNMWATQGQRIEAERFPYISYPAVMPKKHTGKLQPVKQP